MLSSMICSPTWSVFFASQGKKICDLITAKHELMLARSYHSHRQHGARSAQAGRQTEHPVNYKEICAGSGVLNINYYNVITGIHEPYLMIDRVFL
jgi:hypothetical protein